MKTQSSVALAALLVVSSLSGCGQPQTLLQCSPDTCRGCCDAEGLCQPGTSSAACGQGGFACDACGAGTSCQAFGMCHPLSQPAPVDAGAGDAGVRTDAGLDLDAGLSDAGPADAGELDAGVDAGFDAGVDCGGTWVTNPGFECGLVGWQVLEGSGRSGSDAWEGTSALVLTTDSRGFARVAVVEPITVTAPATLCVAVNARGTVPSVKLEVLVTPSNVGTAFAAPVSTSWSRVPPSMLAVPVTAGSQAWVMVRANSAAPGQQLELDGVEVRFSATAACN